MNFQRPLLAGAMLALALQAAAQDTRAIQIREAQRTDERTFAYFAQFRAALVARFGADPLLSKLKFERAGGAGARARDAGRAGRARHLPDRQVDLHRRARSSKPWAPGADPAVARFRLSAVSEAMLREKFRAYRAQPAKAADHLGDGDRRLLRQAVQPADGGSDGRRA